MSQIHFILHDGPDEAAAKALITSVSAYSLELHEEILVFDGGFWDKDHQLWLEVQKANWGDIILHDSFKQAVRTDINGFFNSEEVYHDLGVPWKVRTPPEVKFTELTMVYRGVLSYSGQCDACLIDTFADPPIL